jgi:hypothetical protein
LFYVCNQWLCFIQACEGLISVKAKLKSAISIIALMLRTIRGSIKINAFQEIVIDGILYRGSKFCDLEVVSNIYEKLNNGITLGVFRKIIYSIVGDRILLLAIESHESHPVIVGVNMYYINHRDVVESTIHEGFIGVLPESSGKGIATQMRKFAMMHFGLNNFKGISTRITINNSASLCSAEKTGFVSVEKYFDPELSEYRHYMICDLQGKKYVK